MLATCAPAGVAALPHAAKRRGERRAVRPPLVAASVIPIPPRLCTPYDVVAFASASRHTQRLRDGDCPARGRHGRPVHFEPLLVAHHARDPLGGPPVPPLDDGPGRRAPR